MLKLAQAPTFTGKVQIPLQGGQVAEVVCTFKWMHLRDVREFLSRVQMAARMGSPTARVAQWLLRGLVKVPGLSKWAGKRVITYRTDFDFLNEIVESWEGVDMPWGPDACKALIDQHPSAVGLILGAWCTGLADQRLGN